MCQVTEKQANLILFLTELNTNDEKYSLGQVCHHDLVWYDDRGRSRISGKEVHMYLCVGVCFADFILYRERSGSVVECLT